MSNQRKFVEQADARNIINNIRVEMEREESYLTQLAKRYSGQMTQQHWLSSDINQHSEQAFKMKHKSVYNHNKPRRNLSFFQNQRRQYDMIKTP